MIFRQKCETIEAHRWHKLGDHPDDENRYSPALIRQWPVTAESNQVLCEYCGRPMHMHGWLKTTHGGALVCPGDWIIKHPSGSYHPCNPENFDRLYEAVHEHEE